MLNIKAIWAAIAGLVVVGGVGTYVVLDNKKQDPEPVAISTLKSDTSSSQQVSSNQNAKPSDAEDAVKSEEASADAAEKPSEEKTEVAALDTNADSAMTSPTTDWKVPAFDVLRVEPDGSTVIAGQGEPGTTISVMSGDKVLAETEVASSGDFVIIFDEALNAGDYELSLKLQDAEGNSVVSDERAIVSVPEDADGQLLAMVSKPGEASRVLTQPEAKVEPKTDLASNSDDTAVDGDKDADAGADAEPATTEVADSSAAAKTEDEGETGQESVTQNAVPESADVADASDATVDEETGEEAEVVASEEKAAEEAKDAVADAPAETAAKDTGADHVADADTMTEDTTNVEMKPSDVAEAKSEDMTETASESAKEVEPKVVADVRIEAVEVEGDKLFVAGTGTKGNKVRVFVDDQVVGATSVTSEGRFLLEAVEAMSVGQHKITAALEDKSGNVLIRAIVPFDRPAEAAAAAVASNDIPSDEAAPTEVVSTEMKVEESEPVEVAQVSDEVKEQSSGGADMSASSEGIASDKADGSSEKAAKKDESGDMAKEVDSAVSDASEAKAEESDSTRMPKSDEAVDQEVASSEMSTKDADASTTNGSASDGDAPKTIVQDSLTPSASKSVIIRKGDTLWQIARRTYGAGVRYTTIYLANEEQIQNPNRISPGQIFSVPEEAIENAEEIHRKLRNK